VPLAYHCCPAAQRFTVLPKLCTLFFCTTRRFFYVTGGAKAPTGDLLKDRSTKITIKQHSKKKKERKKMKKLSRSLVKANFELNPLIALFA
jgi:hypothetical protein